MSMGFGMLDEGRNWGEEMEGGWVQMQVRMRVERERA